MQLQISVGEVWENVLYLHCDRDRDDMFNVVSEHPG